MVSLRVLAISVIGKHNNPLFLKSFSANTSGEADLKWYYAAHTSLDFFEEREAIATKQSDTYLGMLYAMEDYAVYGYQTNTRIKFVLILALVDAVVRDLDVKLIFKAIHNAYIEYLSNPFTTSETDNPAILSPPIKSKRFDKSMEDIVGVNLTS